MKTSLEKKDKIYLIFVAILIASSWFVPSIIRKSTPKLLEKTTTKERKENKALEKAINYLADLKELSSEELEKILNIPESTVAGYKITNAVYNAQNAKFDVQIQILNSYLETSLFLEKDGENWKIKEIETSDKLKYSTEGIKLEHDFDWMIVPQEVAEGLLNSWMLQPKNQTSDIRNQRLLFLVEDSQGNYSDRLTDCSFEEISGCSEESIGKYVYKTAEVGNQEVKVLTRSEKARNLIIILPYGENYAEGTEINTILKSITFE